MRYSEAERKKYYFTHILPQRLARRQRGDDIYSVKIPYSKMQELVDHAKEVYATGTNHLDEERQNVDLMLSETQPKSEGPTEVSEATTTMVDVSSDSPKCLLRRASELQKLHNLRAVSTGVNLKELDKILSSRNNGKQNVEETLQPDFISVKLVIHSKASEPDLDAGTVAIGYGATTADALKSAVDAALVQFKKMKSTLSH